MSSDPRPHVWSFNRIGGIDQVRLETAADLLALDQLDPKLWVALGCPVQGIELDERTLRLIDTDNDGRIRSPEVIAAVKWAAARLRDPATLLQGADELPLAAVQSETEAGRVILGSAGQILANLGRPDASAITVADATDTARIFSASPLNGDGVIPPEATEDASVQALIKEIVACLGGSGDRAGGTGVTAEKIEAFFSAVSDYVTWVEQSGGKDIAILGEATAAACSTLQAVRSKVEDYFGRTRVAAYDARSLDALNRSAADYAAVAEGSLKLAPAEMEAFPLARIETGRPLPLFEGVNPAWAAALAKLQSQVVAPLLGADRTSLSEEEWLSLNARFAPYETWLGGKKGGTVEKLGVARMKEILAGDGRAALDALVARDRELEPHFKAISDVERLVRYHRDLRTLLHNYVNFSDFYSPDRSAVFQAGTLYLDNRSTELCLRVAGPNPLNVMSKAYIAYCSCTRPGEAPMTIAACFTQGDSDYLFVGRRGEFFDRKGRDWDAAITAVVDNPISIRQAFWAPYKKFVRLIEEQVAKRAAAAEAQSSGKLAAAAEKTANADKAAPDAAPKKVDVGTVAALGVAVGAIGGALGAIATGLAGLAIWQLPLVVVGLILVISLPSMAIAALKLKQRTLGPILESNGWAVNGRVRINIPFGAALTELGNLPPGSRRSLDDPYADKAAIRRRRLLIALVIALVLAAISIRWDHNRNGKYFWQDPPEPTAAEVEAAVPPETAEPPPATP